METAALALAALAATWTPTVLAGDLDRTEITPYRVWKSNRCYKPRPPNILISRRGEVKLVDFGLAKATSQLESTDPGVVKGKFSYLSPEAAWHPALAQLIERVREAREAVSDVLAA